ncbi:Ribosomal RNA small subunit methyltransferase C [Sinobacterium norvegicum]|uniref:Ribosomal RNA small subunit methyltransferase C n=1 Tax=Sinobacterium norvegicum TaxID=1641715 RepID=A0ABN8EFZ9_9GAMM|nr:methyltransferase [Sinobacterium norvegicum]CAH0990267.1 Ribosomal RNA small subunit methyltransferase C [Sinobacterium norvegicum]
MLDHSSQQLSALINAASDTLSLWFVDEATDINCLSSIQPRDNLSIISNRYDLHQQALACGLNSRFGDFTLAIDQQYEQIFFRIAKEKPIVHYLINRSADLLVRQGLLTLVGEKGDGTKTYIDKAKKYFNSSAQAKKNNIIYTGHIRFFSKGKPLDDKHYTSLQTITDDMISKPGVFGWNKIDQGSKYLVDNLAEILASNSIASDASVLDLGCGYGYLSIEAAKLGSFTFTATDNNAVAVSCCQANLEQRGIAGQALASHCADNIEQRFDLVLCNPPFHTGFDTDKDLTPLFLQQAKQHLNSNGVAVFVVNSFIPLEAKAESIFKTIEVIAKNTQFKVVALR